jgi:hypothetical protein
MAPTYRPPVPFSANVNSNEGGAAYPVGGPFAGLQATGVMITAAQLLAMNTTPVTIVPAPAAGQFIVPHFAILRYNAGTVAFAGAVGVLQFSVGTALVDPNTNAGALLTLSTANIGAAASTIETVTLVTATAAGSAPLTTALAAGALTVKFSAANPTLGNGTLHISVYYNTDTTT